MSIKHRAFLSMLVFGFFLVLIAMRLVYPIPKWDNAILSPMKFAMETTDSTTFEIHKNIALSALAAHGCNEAPMDDCTAFYRQLESIQFSQHGKIAELLSFSKSATKAPANYWAHKNHGFNAFMQFFAIIGGIISLIMTIGYLSLL